MCTHQRSSYWKNMSAGSHKKVKSVFSIRTLYWMSAVIKITYHVFLGNQHIYICSEWNWQNLVHAICWKALVHFAVHYNSYCILFRWNFCRLNLIFVWRIGCQQKKSDLQFIGTLLVFNIGFRYNYCIVIAMLWKTLSQWSLVGIGNVSVSVTQHICWV